MGNQDNWTTPKQIKIERAGEPRGTRRGPKRKADRRKGKKARMDEVLAAFKECQRYKKYLLDDQQRRIEHPEWYTPPTMGLRRYDPEYKKWFGKAQLKLWILVGDAVRDNVMTFKESKQYEVWL